MNRNKLAGVGCICGANGMCTKIKGVEKIEKIFKMYVKRNGACVLARKLHVPTGSDAGSSRLE